MFSKASILFLVMAVTLPMFVSGCGSKPAVEVIEQPTMSAEEQAAYEESMK